MLAAPFRVTLASFRYSPDLTAVAYKRGTMTVRVQLGSPSQVASSDEDGRAHTMTSARTLDGMRLDVVQSSVVDSS